MKKQILLFTFSLFIAFTINAIEPIKKDLVVKQKTDITKSETVTDYDGNVYQTVQIGYQIWMAENLKTTHYADGTSIVGVYIYDDDPANLSTYGRLYTWEAAMRGSNTPEVQGVCPDEYHFASDNDWKVLESELGIPEYQLDWSGNRGTDQGTQLKIEGSSGFDAVLGGFWWYPGSSYWYLGTGYYWTSTETDENDATYRGFGSHSQVTRWTDGAKQDAMSVRCIKTPEPVSITFNLNMTDPIAEGEFIEGTDHLWLAGSMNSWAEPGTDPIMEMTESATNDIYTLTLGILPGNYQYKYYINTGLDGGEWDGEPNRELIIGLEELTLNDVWGPEPVKEITDLLLSNTLIPHNIKENEQIGKLEAVQEQSFPPIDFDYSYTLTTGEGSTDNDLFQISGDTLKSNVLFDLNSQVNFSIRVNVFDGVSKNFEKSFDLILKQSNWEKQNTLIPGITGIGEVNVIDENTIWIRDWDYLARTIDGGDSWTPINTFADKSVGGLYAINTDTAWLVVSYDSDINIGAGLHKTIDGGQSWTRQSDVYNETNSFPNFVHFWNENDGFVAGDNLELYTTTNGGDTWESVTGVPALTNYQINSSNTFSVIADTMWYVTRDAVYRSPDKGHTWEAFNVTIPSGSKIAFKNAQEGLIIEAYSGEKLLYSSNAGESWAEISPTGDYSGYWGIIKYDPIDERFVLSASDQSGISYSYDNGLTWQSDTSFYFTGCTRGLDFHHEKAAWVGGFNGDIFKYIGLDRTNHQPSDIVLKNGSFNENNTAGVIVDTINVIDEEGNNDHTITFVDQEGYDNSDFTLEGNILKTSVVFDFENKNSYSLLLQAEDNYNLTLQKEVVLQINDLNESPEVNDSLLDQITREDEAFSFTISDTVFKDPDAGDVLEYSATLSDESPIPAWLTFNASIRTFSGTPADMDLKSIRVIAEDQEGLNVYDDFILVVEGYDEITEEELAIDTTSSDDVVTITISEQLFIDMGLGDDIEYTASLADGSPLPSYIVFDPATLTFTITLDSKKSYKEILAELDIIVTGVDSEGYIATIGFTVEGAFLSDGADILIYMKIYPNPVREKLHIENKYGQDLQIEIYDLTGKLVKNAILTGENGEIDVKTLKPSMYLLKITMQGKSRIIKIIKN